MILHQVNRSKVIELQQMFTPAECARFEKLALDAGFSPQRYLGGEHRERAVFDSPGLAGELWQRLGEVVERVSLREMYGELLRPEPDVAALGVYEPAGLNERMRFYRYRDGARFVLHHDISYESELRSFLTVLIYSSESIEGGATSFVDGPKIKPTQGTCVIFPHELPHQGMPVTSGTKVVLRTDVMFRLMDREGHDVARQSSSAGDAVAQSGSAGGGSGSPL